MDINEEIPHLSILHRQTPTPLSIHSPHRVVSPTEQPHLHHQRVYHKLGKHVYSIIALSETNRSGGFPRLNRPSTSFPCSRQCLAAMPRGDYQTRSSLKYTWHFAHDDLLQFFSISAVYIAGLRFLGPVMCPQSKHLCSACLFLCNEYYALRTPRMANVPSWVFWIKPRFFLTTTNLGIMST